MQVPAQRFQPATASPSLASGRPLQPARPATLSPTEVTRRVSASGLIDPTVDDPSRPVLLALSDNGPQMTSGSTREFMALCAIHQHFGRPGTPPTRHGSSRCSAMSRLSGHT